MFNNKILIVIGLIFFSMVLFSCQQNTMTVEIPTFNPPAGEYTSSQSVKILCATEGAVIRYTLDGTEPTIGNGEIFSGGNINISSSKTIKAKAFTEQMESFVATASYTIKAMSPAFNPSAGTYTSTQSVNLSCGTSGATVFYTTNGSTPSQSNGIEYSSPITINENTTIKAIAYKEGIDESTIVTADYFLKPVSPTISPSSGTYNSTSKEISIYSNTSGATVFYTTNGSTPSQSNGIEYSSPISIGGPYVVVKAIAYKSNWNNSDISSNTYNIAEQKSYSNYDLNIASGETQWYCVEITNNYSFETDKTLYLYDNNTNSYSLTGEVKVSGYKNDGTMVFENESSSSYGITFAVPADNTFDLYLKVEGLQAGTYQLNLMFLD